MNTAVFSVVILLAMTSVTFGIVCTPDMCNGVKCAGVTAANCAGKIVKNGGFCGCCDSCVAILKAGQSCSLLHLLGAPIHVTCDDGLLCSPTTSKCEAIIV